MRGVLIVAVLVLAGCAATSQERMNETMASWVGQPADRLVGSEGYPTRQFRAPNGNTVLVYETSRSIQMPGMISPGAGRNAPMMVHGGGTAHRYCQRFFEIDGNQRIVAWRWEGRDCRAP